MPFNTQLGVFDDEQFNDFSKDKELMSVNDYLFCRDEIHYLTLVVKYKQLSSQANVRGGGSSSDKSIGKEKNNEEWREILDDNSIPLFNTLRQWRNEKGKKDGIPPYIILNNKQLAQVCQKRPQSKYDLMKIDGIGKAKAEKYGDDILKITLHSEVAKENDEQAE